MEKKTIGGFIATLRKANGMTQRELAERLNVSDKTVSRWERDDGAPDLATIPVLAEIFGVTCDELLRGERRSPAQRADPEPTPKGEKQRQRLLAIHLSRYKARSFAAMGISVAGLIAAMVANFGCLRAYIGFLVGALFYLASVICQAVFVNSAFLSVSDDSPSDQEAGRFRWSVVQMAERSYVLTAMLLAFSLPLVLFPSSAYTGLLAATWFVYGGLFAGAALLLAAIVCWFFNPYLLKNKLCCLPEKTSRLYYVNHQLKRSCTVGLVVALAITLLFHWFGTEVLWSSAVLTRGTVFHDYESFVAYMEQDTTRSGKRPTTQVPVPQDPDDQIRTLEDADGNVVCTYVHRNLSVTSLRYSRKAGTVLPITAVTAEQSRAAVVLSEYITMAYFILYPLELLATLWIYFRKRAK